MPFAIASARSTASNSALTASWSACFECACGRVCRWAGGWACARVRACVYVGVRSIWSRSFVYQSYHSAIVGVCGSACCVFACVYASLHLEQLGRGHSGGFRQVVGDAGGCRWRCRFVVGVLARTWMGAQRVGLWGRGWCADTGVRACGRGRGMVKIHVTTHAVVIHRTLSHTTTHRPP